MWKYIYFVLILGTIILVIGNCHTYFERHKLERRVHEYQKNTLIPKLNLIRNDSIAKAKKLVEASQLEMEKAANLSAWGKTLEKIYHQIGLFDVQLCEPSIQVDLAFASEANFCRENFYGGLNKCYLAEYAAYKLAQAQRLLKTAHPELSLLVWDCTRPARYQSKMVTIAKNTSYEPYIVKVPPGSAHNYGAAVDLTLVHRDTGLVDMGTKYYEFTEATQSSNEKKMLQARTLEVKFVKHRNLLRKAMFNAGFQCIGSEWWQFNVDSKDVIVERFQLIE